MAIDTIGSKSASLPPTPSKQLAGVKRQRKVDATKFNRSNRESKNCGTFYFKHSDTEPENGSSKNNGNDWSSQDATSEMCSDEEEWEYSKGSDVNGNASNGNGDAGDNDQQPQQLEDLSIQVNVNDDSILIDTVDSPSAEKQVSFQNGQHNQRLFSDFTNEIHSLCSLERRWIRISISIDSVVNGQSRNC